MICTFIKPERLKEFYTKHIEYGFSPIGHGAYQKIVSSYKRITVWSTGKMSLYNRGSVVHDIPFDDIAKLVWDGLITKRTIEGE